MFARIFLRYTIASLCALIGFAALAIPLLRLLLMPETWVGAAAGAALFSITAHLTKHKLP